MDSPSTRFPWWIPIGGFLLAALYLPTLATPFDFIDDGNLVYPDAKTSAAGHIELWWGKVRANYDHLGPFRPTLWAHWQLQANLFNGDASVWRLYRLLWCGLAAVMFLWLLCELGARPVAALFATALAMWNPYRNEIWTSLTLAEGVAMPYAIFSLVAARKAANSPRPLKWEIASALAVFVALGCKNVFVALVPAQIILRLWPDGMTLREAWRRNGWRSLALAVTLVMPAAHYVYFKQHWHPGQYETQPPSFDQFSRIMTALKGAMSFEFMAAGLVLTVVCLVLSRRSTSVPAGDREAGVSRAAVTCAVLLIGGGVVMYLPMTMISGRYAMPAVWGIDILFALLLTALALAPLTLCKRAAWVGLSAGLMVVAVGSVSKQERFGARAKMLWDALHYVEATTPTNARIAWISGDSTTGGLGYDEGIHFQWHLSNRGRGNFKIGLIGSDWKPLDRSELAALDGPPQFVLFGKPADGVDGWEPERTFAAGYALGRKRYDCYFSRKLPAGFAANAVMPDDLFP